jgi:hypothetical protein
VRRDASPARWPLPVVVALFLLRLWTGLFFCDAAKWKLFDHPSEQGLSFGEGIHAFVRDEYVPMVERAIADPPEVLGTKATWFASLLRDVALPGKDVLGPTILVAEALLGISLVFGIGVRLSASLGFLMMVSFTMAKDVYLFTAGSANGPVTAILLVLAISAAGRAWGLDAVLRRRLPRGIAWIC